jgi:pyruvate kinase
LTITPREVPGTASLVGTTFKTLAENVEQGSRILLSDGLIELRVHEVLGGDVVCEIVNGGMLGENKGINLPGIPVRVPSLTEKDSEDLEFALKNGVDAIAVSFVRTAEDVRLVRNRVAAYGGETWIIAKLEKPQAIEHLDAFCRPPTASWWPAAIWASKCRRSRFPPFRSTSSAAPPSTQAGDHRDADAGVDD